MQRRKFLGTLAALPVTPNLLTSTATPTLPVEEDSELWWIYVQHSILNDPKYCNENFLDTAVRRSNLSHTSDEEERRVIRAAFNGDYSPSDVPADHRQITRHEEKSGF